MTPVTEFVQRRRRLLEAVGQNSVILVAAAPQCLRNGDSHYPYRQDSNFYYLTGFPEPEAVAVLLSDDATQQFILFSCPMDAAQAIWNGPRVGQLGACADYAADQAYALTELAARLPGYLAGRQQIYFQFSRNISLLKAIHKAWYQLQSKPKQGGPLPSHFVDLAPYLHEMRLHKSPTELALLAKAAQISAKAHCRAMQACQPGLYEYQLEAELLHEFYYQGSRNPAYNSIVATGVNACTLHYSANQTQLQDGQLLLIDAGCEYQGYAADITRTFPVNGRFTAEQRAIYQVVLEAQLAAMATIKPGSSWNQLQTIICTVITTGLLDLGLLQGSIESLMEQKAYRRFYGHSSGHWLGLDVHDVGDYRSEQGGRLLQADMVLTVEPGLYITAAADIEEKWWNIGVRIEDEVRVTAKGYELFSANAPKEIAAIEALMRS